MLNDPATLSPEAEAVLEKVRKLLALAANNDNEHQAAAASAKAMELLEAYNLSMADATVTRHSSTRKDETKGGGLYGWQRDLWDAIARLHFCRYWSIRGLAKGSKYEQRILGSQVNVTSARVMAEYLQATVERLAQKWAKETGYRSVFVREAIAYREGMAARLVARLNNIRWDRLEEERKARDAAKAARDADAAARPASGNSIILADVIQTEDDLNNDYLCGWEPGTTARRRAEREARQQNAMREAEEELRRRDEAEAANPALKEARLRAEAIAAAAAKKQQEEWEKRWSRRSNSYRERQDTPREARARMGSFHEGYAKGADIGLDQQVDQSRRGLL